ncbi:unnamed protein product, partial [Mesorhabditis spiculigera]
MSEEALLLDANIEGINDIADLNEDDLLADFTDPNSSFNAAGGSSLNLTAELELDYSDDPPNIEPTPEVPTADDDDERDSRFSSERNKNTKAKVPDMKNEKLEKEKPPSFVVKIEPQSATTKNVQHGYAGFGGKKAPASSFQASDMKRRPPPQHGQGPAPSLMGLNLNRTATRPAEIHINPKFARSGLLPSYTHPPAPFGAIPASAWDQQVAQFLAHASTASRRSPSSDSSRSRARSRSRSPRERRRHPSPGRDRERRRSPRNSQRSRKPSTSPRKQPSAQQSALESAKALGLDESYLEKLEEQKRRREELLSRKGKSAVSTNVPEPKPAPASPRFIRKISPETETMFAKTTAAKDNKNKACLVVSVSDVSSFRQNALHKIRRLAVRYGPLKRIWCEDEKTVKLIFDGLKTANTFFSTQNGKIFDGVMLNVMLAKEYHPID